MINLKKLLKKHSLNLFTLKTYLMKEFNLIYNVGRAKYVIKYHNGEKFHIDGSRFFDISIFKNKQKFQKEIKILLTNGYIQK